MHIPKLITMSENDEKSVADIQAMLDTVDFKKVSEMAGIPAVGMVEQAKLMQLQLEYFMHLEEMIFEMVSMMHITRFGAERGHTDPAKDKSYETVYKMYFPRGRQYYKEAIAKLEMRMNDVSKPVNTDVKS
jgi:hypothetical protein